MHALLISHCSWLLQLSPPHFILHRTSSLLTASLWLICLPLSLLPRLADFPCTTMSNSICTTTSSPCKTVPDVDQEKSVRQRSSESLCAMLTGISLVSKMAASQIHSESVAMARNWKYPHHFSSILWLGIISLRKAKVLS